MPHRVITLRNGLRLVHKQTDSPISHFGVLVNAGTRDESAQQMGLAHFVEHTIFKSIIMLLVLALKLLIQLLY